MYSGSEIVGILHELGITHVVWLPDSTLGAWEAAIEQSPRLKLIRVCRESEAWGIAAGLYIGGAKPLVIIQTTGLFDSGDAIRNFLFDMQLPLFAILGYRSYLIPNSPDTAKRFAEPILRAWGITYVVLATEEHLPQLAAHYRACQAAGQSGIALVAEERS